jgi:hypothetical protein
MAPTGVCNPTAGGPYWLEEGEAVTAAVKCATNRAGETFSVGMLPAGAVWNAATATLTWKTGLDAAAVYLLPITAMPSGDKGELKIGVADKFDDPMNVAVKDPAAYTEEYGLPVMHLTPSAGVDQALPKLQARQSALWNNPCMPMCGPSLYAPVKVVYRGKTYAAEGHYRGASSLGYPKRNYTLRFDKDDKFNEPFAAGGAMRKRRRLALITTFDDNSYLRWRLAFETWNRLDPKIIRVEHMSAVVYLNGKYLGLYAISDKIDDNMMERAGLAETGNLYMGIDHNANFDVLARNQSNAFDPRSRRCPFEGFTKKEGTPEECDPVNQTTFVPSAYNDLVTLLDFVARADDAKFNADVAKLIDVRDIMHWWIHATATVSNDSYAKNALHYHDPMSAGPWRTVIWDYNASFGQTWNTVRTTVMSSNPLNFANTPAMGPSTNNLWRRLLVHPTLGPMMKARYKAVLNGELKLDTVLAVWDAMAKEVAPSAKRDERKWQAMYRSFYKMRTDFTTFDQEIAYTRMWITQRWSWLKSLFP